jgi:hypothetical protein
MRLVTEISLVSLPAAEPEPPPPPRRLQIAPSADGRAVVTVVSWLAPSAAAGGGR